MWWIKSLDTGKPYNKTQMAKIIGTHPDTLRKIFNGKKGCTRLVAYSITKFLDNNKELEDYFIWRA